jgi:hypothetical protein
MARNPGGRMWKCWHVMPEFSLRAILTILQIWTITTKNKFSNGALFFSSSIVECEVI